MANLTLCPDCDPGTCLTCDKISLISTDNSIGITKSIIDEVCTFNIKINSISLLSKEDTSTIILTGDGTPGNPLKADLKLSSNPSNIASVDSEGLLVLASSSSETPNTKTDTNSLAITLSGTSSRNIKGDVKISTLSGNNLTVQGDGLYVPTPSSAIGLTSVNIQDSASIDLSGNGTAGNPLIGTVKISATALNEIQIIGGGLYVHQKTHFSVVAADFEPDGTTYIDTSLAGKDLSVWLMSVGRFIYSSMSEITIFPSGGFEILIPGFDATTDKIEVFIKN